MTTEQSGSTSSKEGGAYGNGALRKLDAPFPLWTWFGGKSRVAAEVWRRFGNVPNFVEAFFGSGAVLLGRPHEPRVETVNDKDGYVSNFWRAVQHDPEQTAHYADWPVNENDLHARHAWLVARRDDLTSRLEGDPDYYDVKIAGWWVWGICAWIGRRFCSGEGPWQSVDGRLVKAADDAAGVQRNRVHLNAGQGVNRKRVKLMTPTSLQQTGAGGLLDWFTALSDRLRHVRVCSGDWARVLGPTPTFKQGITGVFLDPPYSHQERDSGIYSVEMPIATAVRDWAVANGANPELRIALCGYEGEHEMPDTWEKFAWKAGGGYGNLGADGRGQENAPRERIWFSPACLKDPQQGALL